MSYYITATLVKNLETLKNSLLWLFIWTTLIWILGVTVFEKDCKSLHRPVRCARKEGLGHKHNDLDNVWLKDVRDLKQETYVHR